MKIKIFQVSGFDGIQRSEGQINRWIRDNFTDDIAVKDIQMQMALCQIADSETGERYQHMVVCIWYDLR